MKFTRILCTTALLGLALGLSAAVAHADGTDPKLKMGGGTGSPNCFGADGVSFQGSTGTGTFSVSCVNNGPVDIGSFSFDILATNAPGGITPSLDQLLAPFAGTPLAFLDWTIGTDANGQCPESLGIIVCTATQSTAVTNPQNNFCASTFTQNFCTQASKLSATQMEQLFPLAFLLYNGNPCADPFVYITFGIIPGCDVTNGSLPPGPGQGNFVAGATFDTVLAGATPAPLPEPSSLSLLFLGLGGLPFLRRKLARS